MARWWHGRRPSRSPERQAPGRRSQAARFPALLLVALAAVAPLVLDPAKAALAGQQPGANLHTATTADSAADSKTATPGARRQQAARRFLAQRGIRLEALAAVPGGTASQPQNAPGLGGPELTSAATSPQINLPQSLRQARAQQRRLLQKSKPDSANPASQTWQSLGPAQVTTAAYGAVTGRITSLAADRTDSSGNTLYLGSTGGGVWKSTNAAGASPTFTPLTDDLPAFSSTLGSLSIGAVSVQPGSSNVILAGTGDINDALDSYYGVGILRSSDGGLTWSLISNSHDAFQGGLRNYSFTGNGFAGFAWSTANSSLVVAAVAQSAEGVLVNAGSNANMEAGLYYSSDAGQTWYLAVIEDGANHIIQSPNQAGSPPGNSATSVIWNPIRQRFYAAIRFHGYYESADGVTWTRLANQPTNSTQSNPGLSPANCPTNPGGTGQTSCPIFRGVLAVQPVTGDLFALTTDLNNQDQGLFQDVCSTNGLAVSSCASNTVTFARQLSTTAIDASPTDPTIAQADYNLSLAAVSSQQDTVLFAGTEDLYRCSLANSCAWRNTTNIETCASAQVAPSQHATESSFGASGLLYFANDGGLWRSTDTVSQTGSVCASTDANHYQNLNSGLGSLAEINHFSISQSGATTLLAGLPGFGTVATANAQGAWQQVLTGDGSYTAIDPANAQNWYTDSGEGVNIHRCTAGANCNAAGFGASPAIGSAQVSGDADYEFTAAPWILDPLNSAELLVGTCRVWRGAATGGSAWTTGNILSQILDTNQQAVCNGNATLRSIGGGLASNSPAGSEQIYVGMAGPYDGGNTVPGHVYTSTVAAGGGQTTWADLDSSPVSNSSNQPQFNPGGFAISSIAVDPHDGTGQTVYVTTQGFSGNGISGGEVYGSTDGGAHWNNLTNSLPLAPANSILVDPNVASIVYVALDTGVYYTTNITACADQNQTCWAVYGSGLPNAPVTELHAYSAGTGSLLEASTYGRGIWSLPLLTAAAQASLNPSSYTFAGQQLQTTSSANALTLNNTGLATLSIAQIAVTGDYAQVNNCGASLAAGASCTIQVTFTPTVAGDRPGTLTVYGNVSGGQIVATLDGRGLNPGAISASPASVTFPSTVIGATAAAQSVTLQDTGDIAVQLQAPTVTTDYHLTANSCGSTLGPGATCTLQVTFSPSAAGDRTGRLSVATNLPGSPSVVPLDGTGTTPAALTFSPASLSFPATATGAVSAAQTITVTSSGGTTAQLQAPTVTGDYQIANNTCGATLATNSTCTLQIAFAPTATGSRAGLLTIQANVSGGQATAALNGTGVTPAALSFAPSALSFPSTAQGATSAAQAIQLTNSGGASATLQTPIVTGDYAVQANNCGGALAPGASCTLQLTFTPTGAGDRPGQLKVPANVTSGQVTASLDGTGLVPSLALSPTSVSFPNTAQGATSPAQVVTLTNSGGATAQLQTATVAGDFAISANSCGATLAPSASCTLQITFSPSATGTRTGQLTAPSASPGNAPSAALTGSGVPPAALTLSPNSLTFSTTGQGTTSASQTITVTSTGGVSAQLQAPSITGDFQITSNTCGASLAPNTNCTIQVAFAPTAAGARTGQLTLQANVTGGSVTAALSGTGATPAALSASPASLNFAATTRGATTPALSVQFSSTGGVSAQLGAPTISGDYAISANSCGATLAPNATCTIQVTFTPTATGDRTGQLTVPANVSGNQVTVALDGSGVAPAALAFAPASLNFGSAGQGAITAAQSITLTNSGGTSAQLQTATISGDYAITANSCSAALAPGANCVLQITFTPAALGSRTGTLSVGSNAPSSPTTASLSGTGLAPAAISFSPNPANFGSVVEGTASSPISITVSNTGGADAQIQSVSITQDATEYQASANNCGAAIAAGSSCTIQVTFHPGNSGSSADRPGTLALAGNMPGSPATEALHGTGLTPGTLTLTPNSYNYQTVQINTTTAAQPFTLSNTGGAPVALQAISVSGQYQVTANACGATLAAGATCQIHVAFSPTTAGNQPGQLVVPAPTVPGGQVIAQLDGVGATAASLSITPTSVNFGSVVYPSSSSSAPVTLTLTNNGGLPAHFVNTTVSGDFSLSGSPCAGNLLPGASCTLQITFTPTASGTRTGAITINTDAANSPTVATLTGTGVAAASVTLNPGSLTFAPTVQGSTSAQQTLTATNTGGVAAALSPPALTGDYQLVGSNCGGSLAAGASCTLQVIFAPSATGNRPGSISLPGQFTGSPVGATLDGTGVTPGQLTLTPAGLTFGALVVGGASSAQSVTVTNAGGSGLTLQALSTTGDYQATSNCGATLAAGASCTVQVSFHPTAPGDRPGTLILPANVVGGHVTASLDGTGLRPAVVVITTPPNTATPFSFGGILLNTNSSPATFVATNSGEVPVHLQPATLSGANAGDFAISLNTCSATLAPSATCTLQVVFTPSALAGRQATLSLASDAPGSPATFALPGTGLSAGSVSLAPSSLSFAATVDGTTSAPQTLTATNPGGVSVALSPPTLSPGYQLAANTCASSLAPAATCTLQVVFAPAAPGDQQGALTLLGQYTSSPAAVTLDGTGIAPGFLLPAPGSLQFGTIQVGSSSSPQTVIVSNSGGVAVQLGAPGASRGYSVASTTCAASLAPGASCSLSVVFTPLAAGDEPGLLSLPGSIAGSQITVALDGSGFAPGALTLAPASLVFAGTIVNTSSAAQTLTLSNPGGSALTLQTPVISSDFQISSSTCGASLAPGASCTLQVLFHPSAAGSRSGQIAISGGSAPSQRAQASLAGTGLTAAQLTFAPNSLTFPSTLQGKTSAAQAATLSNQGGVVAQLRAPVVTGDYSLSADTCGASLSPGATCTVQVLFSPTQPGDRTGTVALTTADGSVSAVLALDGASTAPPSLVTSPTSLTFGATLVGATTAAQNVVAANVGLAAIQLQAPTITGDFAISANTCTAPSVAPDYSCTLSVTFSPTTGGARTGALTISDATETRTVQLTGTGLAPPTDTLTPSALTFGPQLVGTVSAIQSVTLTNSGGGTLNAIATSVTGPFIATNNCGIQLGGNLSCTIAIAFAPTQGGAQTGQLTVSDAIQTQTVALTGQGQLAPRAVATPTSLSFGGYLVNAVSPAQTVTFTNNGTEPITGFTAATGNPNFPISSNTCGDPIPAGVVCTIGVAFAPQAIGNQTGQLTLTSTSPAQSALTIALSGSGEDYQISINGPSSLILANGQSGSFSIVVTPVGASSGSLTMTCTGAPANSSCTPSPATVNIGGNATGSVTVTIATGLTTIATHHPPIRPLELLGSAAGAMALLVPLLTISGRARRTLLLLLVTLALMLAPTACGVHASGGSSATTTSTPVGGTTPTGTYPLTITAAFPGAQRSVNVTLVVQ